MDKTVRETKRADELKPGDMIAEGVLHHRPTEVLYVHAYQKRTPGVQIMHRPLGNTMAILDPVDIDFEAALATEAELTELREQAQRAQKLADLRQAIDFLDKRPWLPLPSVSVQVHLQDDAVGDYRLVRELAEREGVKLSTRLDDRTALELRTGELYYSVIAWHRDGRPAEPERCETCGESLREIERGTLGHIPGEACAPVDDPTGLAYSRADDEPDDPTPVSPGRVPLHTGGMTEQGLVDETRAAVTEACVFVGDPGGWCKTHEAVHIASGVGECGCPVYPFSGRGDAADTIIDHRRDCPGHPYAAS